MKNRHSRSKSRRPQAGTIEGQYVDERQDTLSGVYNVFAYPINLGASSSTKFVCVEDWADQVGMDFGSGIALIASGVEVTEIEIDFDCAIFNSASQYWPNTVPEVSLVMIGMDKQAFPYIPSATAGSYQGNIDLEGCIEAMITPRYVDVLWTQRRPKLRNDLVVVAGTTWGTLVDYQKTHKIQIPPHWRKWAFRSSFGNDQSDSRTDDNSFWIVFRYPSNLGSISWIFRNSYSVKIKGKPIPFGKSIDLSLEG